MRKYALGAVSPCVKTPRQDRLAEEGTLFRNACAHNPACGPRRSILYSGLYSTDCGVQDNEQALREDGIALSAELETAGYETCFVGKMHLGAMGNQPLPEKFRAGHRHFGGCPCCNGFRDNIC